jgi:hypothetical protein
MKVIILSILFAMQLVAMQRIAINNLSALAKRYQSGFRKNCNICPFNHKDNKRNYCEIFHTLDDAEKRSPYLLNSMGRAIINNYYLRKNPEIQKIKGFMPVEQFTLTARDLEYAELHYKNEVKNVERYFTDSDFREMLDNCCIGRSDELVSEVGCSIQ